MRLAAPSPTKIRHHMSNSFSESGFPTSNMTRMMIAKTSAQKGITLPLTHAASTPGTRYGHSCLFIWYSKFISCFTFSSSPFFSPSSDFPFTISVEPLVARTTASLASFATRLPLSAGASFCSFTREAKTASMAISSS